MKPGQYLYRIYKYPGSNEEVLLTYQISKVGRKYFYVEPVDNDESISNRFMKTYYIPRLKLYIEDTKYTGIILYENHKSAYTSIYLPAILKKIRELTSYGNYEGITLENAEKALELLTIRDYV